MSAQRPFALYLTALLGSGALALALLGFWAHRMPAPPLLEGIPYGTAVRSAEGELLHLKRAEDGAYRLPVRLEAVSPEALAALVHYEDRRFWSHPGADPLALLRAAWASATGPRPIGASTITMQVARMRLGLETRSLTGKLAQILWALRYEAHYEKKAILEAYLTLAPYGGNVEGIEAAALIRFGHVAADLTPPEAAALAVVPQNPVKRRPDAANPIFEAERLRVAKRLLAEGVIDAAWAEAMELPLRLRSPQDLPFLAPHYTRLVESLGAEGTFRGTLRLSLQRDLERILRMRIERLSAWGITNGALAVVDTRTGGLVAHVGSKDFFDADIAGEVDALLAPRSPGSTLKPLLYGLALDQGLIHSASILTDRAKSFGGYAPENSDGAFRGPLSATEALLASRNVPAVELDRQLSPNLFETLRRADVPLPFDRAHYGLSVVLGGAEVRMADLLRIYALTATDGLLRPIVLGEAAGRELMLGSAERTPILSPEAAFVVSAMLAERGDTARNARGETVSLRWKTGTSNGFRDAWTAGSVGPYVLVVWLGHFDGSSNPLLIGAEAAVPLFREAAARLARDLPGDAADPAEIPVPKGLNVVRESVCRATGDVGQPLCTDRTDAWFIPGRSPVRDRGILKTILIDRKTGLRACRWNPRTTERVLWEFWPADELAAFRSAGIRKPPPPAWLPECGELRGVGHPRILSPDPDLTYWTDRATKAGRIVAPVRLSAAAASGVRRLHWFVEGRFVGSTRPDEGLEVLLPPGRHTVSVTDDLGGSERISVRVVRS